jgi:hypothetical protein
MMYVPALAARAPLGAMKVATGTGEPSIALMICRIDVSRPPGVSSCSTASCAWPSAARCRLRTMKSALPGPIAPFTGITTTLLRTTAAYSGGVHSHDANPNAKSTPSAATPRINRPTTPPRISGVREPDCRNGRRGYVLIADGCRAQPTGIGQRGPIPQRRLACRLQLSPIPRAA